MNIHEKYMNRCLDLARKGLGTVAPNPMVGCVIVYKGRIIGEGYHQKYGSAHAEVNAINSVKNRKWLKESTLYVNLEPCSHFGNTPPCADLILKNKIQYVVIGTIDPNPVVKGRGLQKLVSGGCDVKVGVLEKECKELNKRFYTFYEKKRPYVILKWAQTADKYIGRSGVKTRIQISGKASQKLVHEWRRQEQAILVGTNTALTDNPKLTARKVKGNNPVRVLIDRQLKVPATFHLLDGAVPTIIFTEKNRPGRKNVDYVLLNFKKDILKQIMKELRGRRIQSLIVEGGSKLLNSFMRRNLWDEARVFASERTLAQLSGMKKDGVKAPRIVGRMITKNRIEKDILVQFSNIS